MTKKPNDDREKQDITGRILDNPDLVDTEKESIFDTDEKMNTVDPIPVEELNEQVKDEENKDATKSTSSSEKRYPG
ncbi:hypothetical protein [Psychrobacillus sp. OK032]|uniref:hypothetical protein n=1 Tax=Psychrobacillus sp. OK032 TaxID=1884358 RepID=UPI0008BD0C87|nr:hypothetical protein [Psychrobacillus sp. OK032]SER99650.1 hypothetical protein SAMN05518872_103106 [Psychrobacillus sp. OK032]